MQSYASANIILKNADDLILYRHGQIKIKQVRQKTVIAQIIHGVYRLIINKETCDFLHLRIIEKKWVEWANEKTDYVSVVGPVEICFKNRRSMKDAIVLPNDYGIILGSIPISEMDVLIDPLRQRLIVNPAHPDMAVLSLK